MFKYALNLVTRRKLRTFLTSLGITIAVVLLSFIIFGMQDLKSLLTDQFTQMFKPNEVIVTNIDIGGMFAFGGGEATSDEESTEPRIMDDALVDEFLASEDILTAEKVLTVPGMKFSIEGIDKTMESAVIAGWDVPADDNYFSDYLGDKVTRENGEVFVDEKALNGFGISREEVIGKQVIIEPSATSAFGMSTKTKSMIGKSFEYTIIGVVTIPQDRNDVLLTVDDASKVMADIGGFESKEEYVSTVGYDSIMLTVNEEKVDEVVSWIEDDFALNTMTSEDMLKFLDTITNGLTIALVMFGIISAVVASIGIINTMIMSIYEQTREIGIAKAIGASNGQVMRIFLIQSGIIGIFGGILGLSIVFLVMLVADGKVVEVLQDAGFTTNQFFHFNLVIALIIALISLIVGVIAGLYPSMKAARLDPIRALRYE